MESTNPQEQFTFFWHGPFSQWHGCRFKIDGVTYNCAEQYMMAQKAVLFKDDATLDKIMASDSPRIQKGLGRKVRGFNQSKWDAGARDIVYRGNWAKFTQNEDLQKRCWQPGARRWLKPVRPTPSGASAWARTIRVPWSERPGAARTGSARCSPAFATTSWPRSKSRNRPGRRQVMYEKIVLVTRKTRLQELVERFNTREQAKFYIEHMGVDFADYDAEHATYMAALGRLRRELDGLAKLQFIDRGFLPNFIFTEQDLVVTVGQDGLVVNTARYLKGQPIVAVNPDPTRYDGILLPFQPAQARAGVVRVLEESAVYHAITMAHARLNDGQNLLAFNDFLVGQRTHVSARYSLRWQGRSEEQSSSGVLVSTGAGSTGWLSSVQNMARSVAALLVPQERARRPGAETALRLDWNDPRLVFVVREPFRTRVTGVSLAAGLLEPGQELQIESHMPEGGAIFSDGVESDCLAFNSGAVAVIRASEQRARLVAA